MSNRPECKVVKNSFFLIRKSKSTKGNMIIVENDECDDQQVLFKLDHAEVATSFDGTTCWASWGKIAKNINFNPGVGLMSKKGVPLTSKKFDKNQQAKHRLDRI